MGSSPTTTRAASSASSASSGRVFRGRALCPSGKGRVELLEDALLEVDGGGRFLAVGPAPAGCGVPESHPGCVLMPGLVDAHLHYPQVRVLGRATGPLLPWLERTIFPEEIRFAEAEHARRVADELCDAMLARGTTCAGIFGSSHPAATHHLFEALARRGLRGMAGLTLMDRGAPPELCLAEGPAIEACEALADRWHGHDGGRLAFALTPRFALSCSSALLRSAGRLAERRQLPIQTHLAESLGELRAVAEAWPEHDDYLAVYLDHGLVGPRSVLGHCVWLDEAGWERVARAGAAVAHCPDSNSFLGSGRMDLRRARAAGVRVALATDVGAGRTFSVLRVAASAYDTALACGAPPPSPESLLWLATLGGAQALGLGDQVGRLAPGWVADLIAVPVSAHASDRPALLESLLFHHDAGPVRAVYVQGRRV